MQNYQNSTANVEQSITTIPLLPSAVEINVNLRFDSIPTDILFMQIVGSYEPIYHSDICYKLKNIAGIK